MIVDGAWRMILKPHNRFRMTSTLLFYLFNFSIFSFFIRKLSWFFPGALRYIPILCKVWRMQRARIQSNVLCRSSVWRLTRKIGKANGISEYGRKGQKVPRLTLGLVRAWRGLIIPAAGLSVFNPSTYGTELLNYFFWSKAAQRAEPNYHHYHQANFPHSSNFLSVAQKYKLDTNFSVFHSLEEFANQYSYNLDYVLIKEGQRFEMGCVIASQSALLQHNTTISVGSKKAHV